MNSNNWQTLFLIAQGEGGGGGAPTWDIYSFIPFIAIGVLFYLMLIRPERKKRSEMNKMLENLKKNDHVVTIGGIYGVVVNLGPKAEEVTIRVDEGSNTRIRVLRSAISRVLTNDDGTDEKSSAR